MNGIVLNNTDVVKLDDKMVMGLTDLSTLLRTNGTVSRSDILSTEEFIGTDIITKKYNANRYTMNSSTIMYEETDEYVGGLLKEYTTTYTMSDIVKLSNDLKHNISRVINLLTNMDACTHIINDNDIMKYYDDKDNLSYHYNRPLIDIITHNHMIKMFNLNTTNIEVDDDNNIFILLDLLTTMEKTINIYSLVSIMVVNNYTINSLKDIFNNKLSYINNLKLFMDEIDSTVRWTYGNVDNINKSYNGLSKLRDIFTDKKTLMLLTMLVRTHE